MCWCFFIAGVLFCWCVVLCIVVVYWYVIEGFKAVVNELGNCFNYCVVKVVQNIVVVMLLSFSLFLLFHGFLLLLFVGWFTSISVMCDDFFVLQRCV